ncbi:DUF1128 family protein [Staphylococcus rostri]|uniref:DUF1128 domain-containing protein n=1 Tax=Staphylococcus rostri TaxID=522262 RepID=A0A2K3YWV7_9STAP|nr:DUF1128 family protein [Staphylococcus rostri]MDO5376562.1 DUF1128 family protein [Staphylococcus rostri]PNZ30085.1 DUF1128 domain-containing protein [Staphylococcus rostri]
MTKDIATMITEIRDRLNLVNKGLIDPDKYAETHREEIAEIHEYVTSKQTFTPQEMSGITEALGALRQP